MTYTIREHQGDGVFENFSLTESELRATLVECLTHLDVASTFEEAATRVDDMFVDEVIAELEQFEITLA